MMSDVVYTLHEDGCITLESLTDDGLFPYTTILPRWSPLTWDYVMQWHDPDFELDD
jgi:hypothetical protein